jgi:pimeloyl-ACP methyl ester carboxylesterase
MTILRAGSVSAAMASAHAAVVTAAAASTSSRGSSALKTPRFACRSRRGVQVTPTLSAVSQRGLSRTGNMRPVGGRASGSRQLEFEAAVEAFLRAMEVPSRRPEPRLAEPLAEVKQQRVPSVEGSLAAWRLGTGPAVLLVHGWEDNHSLWAPLIRSLADQGCAVVAFDMPAHGYSDGERGLNPEAIDAVLAVANALGPVDAVVAHSSGAGVAGLAISEGMAVERAVMIAPPLRGDNRFARYAARLGVPDDVAAAARTIYDERLGPARAAFDLREALPTFDIRLLVVHSVEDERMPFVDSDEVLPHCDQGQLLVVEGLTHRRTARDPHVVARITDFLVA